MGGNLAIAESGIAHMVYYVGYAKMERIIEKYGEDFAKRNCVLLEELPSETDLINVK